MIAQSKQVPHPLERRDIDALKAGVELVEVMKTSGLPLEKRGQNWFARCPFHGDKEASLSVNPEAQLWNCFGCQAGGDVLSFLQKYDDLDFPQAVDRLKTLAGTEVCRSEPREQTEELPGRLGRSELLERVTELYVESFRESEPPQRYLTERGLGEREVWEAFRVGFADGSLLDTLPEDGEVREALTQLGVLTARGRELFSGCVVFPLTHPDRGVVGLYGRKISDRAKVRHLYLPGPKQGVLNWQALKTSEEIYLAESVLDALSLWVAGVREVSCLYGTQSLPRDLDELLGRFGTRGVTFVLDGDRPGQAATERLGAELAGRGIRCYTVELEPDKDPNQLLQECGPEALQALDRRALEFLVTADSEPASERRGSEVEDTGEGFRVKLGRLTYEVLPQPPLGNRLRVRLTATAGKERFLDTLDLYSHRARATAINQISRRLGEPREKVEGHFLRLLDAGEAWVQQRLDAEESAPDGDSRRVPEMTADQREEALRFLRSERLVDQLLEDFESLGYVGENRGKLLGYLIGLSRKLEKPLSGIILSQSGAGKSGLTEAVERLTPPEDVVLYSRISAQALGYLPKDFLKRKLLILEERVGGEAADYSIRVLQSRQKLSQAVVMKDPTTGKMRTRHFEVEGPIAYLETTTNPRLNYENATRCFEVHLDESEEQTRRVHQRQREARTFDGLRDRPSDRLVAERHHRVQRLLEPVKVVIPYVHHLNFPSRWLRTRRDHERFLCLVEASAFLHQFQRKRGVLQGSSSQDEVPYVEATLEDYELAYDLARDVLRATLHELSRNGRELWGAIQEMISLQAGDDPCQIPFSRRELRGSTQWPDRRLRETLEELVDMEYVGILGGSQGRAYRYRLLADTQDGPSPLSQLTTPEELRELWREPVAP